MRETLYNNDIIIYYIYVICSYVYIYLVRCMRRLKLFQAKRRIYNCCSAPPLLHWRWLLGMQIMKSCVGSRSLMFSSICEMASFQSSRDRASDPWCTVCKIKWLASCRWKFVETKKTSDKSNRSTPSAFQNKKRRLEGELPARSSQWTIISCRYSEHEKSWCSSLSWWEIIENHMEIIIQKCWEFQPGLGLIQFHSPLHQSPLHINQRTLIAVVSCRFTESYSNS